MKTLWILLLASSSLYAQQAFVQPVVYNTRQTYNPAIAGSNSPLSFQAAAHTSTLLRTAQVQADGFISRFSLGAGGMLETYGSLLETQNAFRFNLAYRVRTRKGFWQLGLAPVLHNYSFHTGNLRIRSEGDALSPSASQQWALNFNVGVLYKSPRLFLSLYAQNISKSLDPIASEYSYLLGYSSYSAMVRYSFPLNKKLSYEPMVYGHRVKNHGTYVATLHQLSHEYFFVGVQCGWPSSWLANVGLHYQPAMSSYKITLGYSFAQQVTGLQNSADNYLFLSLDFLSSKPKPLKDLPHFRSPIYF